MTTCQNVTNQRICGKVYKSVPCCDAIDKGYLLSPISNISSGVCLTHIFELSKVIVENNLIKFRSRGMCMYPYLRPKDVLCIEPKSVEEIKIGDIAVFRRFDYLYAHRTISKNKYGNLTYILTQPDTSKAGNDGPIFNEDILGIVSKVERRGRILNLSKDSRVAAKKMFVDFYLRWFHYKIKLFKKIIDLVSHIQKIKFYKKIASCFFSKLCRKIEISVRIPANFEMTSRFYQTVSLEDSRPLIFALDEKNKEMISGWSIVACLGSKPAGIISFIHKPKDCPYSGWWISQANIRIRYRNSGLEDRLLKETDEIFKNLGVRRVFAGFCEKGRIDESIVQNLGFKETSLYKDKLQSKDRDKTTATIIMQREIV